jgi:hypothetical protein
VFCPNCGTQNPDTAQTCSKCSFHLKGAAAPKFKGTMLMMNQPVVPNAAPAPGAAPPAGPVAGPAPGGPPRPMGPGGASASSPGISSKLKGTMVGVAPMAGGMGAPPAPVAVPPARSPVPPSPGMAGLAEPSGAYSPPVPQPGVNPLGGTLAADAAAFGGGYGGAPPGGPPAQSPYGAPPPAGSPGFAPTAAQPAYGAPPGYGSPQGAPPGQSPYGAPPPNAYGGGGPPPGYGAPPQGYGAPPQGYGAPPQGYGQPPQGYGGQQPPPPQGGFGPPPGYQPGAPQGYGPPPGYGQSVQQGTPQPMAPYGQGPGGGVGALVGTLPSSGTKGPTRRNALMTLLLPFGVIFGGTIVFTILSMLVTSLASVFMGLQGLCNLVGAGWFVYLAIGMVNELKSVTQNASLAWWPILVPIYNWYWAWFIIPAEVAKAKQLLGVQAPPRPIVLYIFLWPFALASDINDMVR